MRSGDVLAVMVIGATAVFGLAVQKGLQAAHDSTKIDLVELWNHVEETPVDSEVRFELREQIRNQVRESVRRDLQFEVEMRELDEAMEELGRRFEDMNVDLQLDLDGLDLMKKRTIIIRPPRRGSDGN